MYEKWDANELALNIFSPSFDIGFGFSISDLRSVKGLGHRRTSMALELICTQLGTSGKFTEL